MLFLLPRFCAVAIHVAAGPDGQMHIVAVYSLKEHGNISIEEDPDGEYGSIRFRIDDEYFTPEEAAHMLGAYVGWNMKYQIESTSEAYLGEDEYVWKTWQ